MKTSRLASRCFVASFSIRLVFLPLPSALFFSFFIRRASKWKVRTFSPVPCLMGDPIIFPFYILFAPPPVVFLLLLLLLAEIVGACWTLWTRFFSSHPSPSLFFSLIFSSFISDHPLLFRSPRPVYECLFSFCSFLFVFFSPSVFIPS